MIFDLDVAISRAGLRRTLKAEHKLALVNEPTMTINGLTAGYQGKRRQNGDPAYGFSEIGLSVNAFTRSKRSHS